MMIIPQRRQQYKFGDILTWLTCQLERLTAIIMKTLQSLVWKLQGFLVWWVQCIGKFKTSGIFLTLVKNALFFLWMVSSARSHKISFSNKFKIEHCSRTLLFFSNHSRNFKQLANILIEKCKQTKRFYTCNRVIIFETIILNHIYDFDLSGRLVKVRFVFMLR